MRKEINVKATAWRRVVFSIMVAIVGMGAQGAGQPSPTLAAGTAVSGAVPVARQQYVPDQTVAGNPVDPYTSSTSPGSPDPLEVHVAYGSSGAVTHGLFRVELDAVPSGSTLTGGSIVFKTNSSDASGAPQNDVNTAAAKIKACVLKTELPATVNPSSPRRRTQPHARRAR